MKLSIIKNRSKYLLVSAAAFFMSLLIIIFGNLNLWIDMTWWTQWEYSYNSLSIEKLKPQLQDASTTVIHNGKSVVNWSNIYKIAGQKSLSVVVGYDSGLFKTDEEEKKLSELKELFRTETLKILKSADSTVEELGYTNIWKSFWDYIRNTAILTLLIAIIGIALYVTWTFSWVVSGISPMSFALIVIITLFHDVIIATGMYLLSSQFFPQFKVDTFFITALLTILGYSINDTIVIFDRIRANLEKWAKKKIKLSDIITKSVGESIRRSLYTSLTLLFVLFTILFFWPDSISWFVLVMIFGTIIGTYSSIFIASPLLYEFNKNKTLAAIDRSKQDDMSHKIVV